MKATGTKQSLLLVFLYRGSSIPRYLNLYDHVICLLLVQGPQEGLVLYRYPDCDVTRRISLSVSLFVRTKRERLRLLLVQMAICYCGQVTF